MCGGLSLNKKLNLNLSETIPSDNAGQLFAREHHIAHEGIFIYFLFILFIIHLPPEFLALSGPLTRW